MSSQQLTETSRDFDWRWSEGYVNEEVYDQGPCSMCWAISIADCVASAVKIKNPKLDLVPLSSQDLLNNVPMKKKKLLNVHPERVERSPSSTFEYIMKNGISRQVDVPFLAQKEQYPTTRSQDKHLVKISSYKRLDPNDEEALMKQVRIQPVVIGILIYISYKDLGEKIYFGRMAKDDEILGRHAALCVGFGTEELTDVNYFTVKSSHGEAYGSKGYLRVARKSSLQEGWENPIMHASYPIISEGV